MKKHLKRFIVRKYVMASSAAEALKIERKYRPDDCWVDDEWMKNNREASSAIGFATYTQRDYEY